MTKVGDLLIKKRKSLGYTYDEVYKKTKIPVKFIKALEAGEYSSFSNKVHAKGFLKNYSNFLGLENDQILAFWRREYEGYFDMLDKSRGRRKYGGIETPRLVLSPVALLTSAVALMMFGFFTYLFFQYKSFSNAPELFITSPADNEVLSEDVLNISGRTEIETEVFLNEQKLVLNPDGSFSTSIKLNKGINNLSFRAVNKLGKESKVVKTVVLDRTNETFPTRDISEVRESTESQEEPATVLSEDGPNEINLLSEE